MNETNKIKHLEFIQDVINRMGSNSFLLKGMAVTIVAASMGIYATNKIDWILIVAVFPALISWFLDAYYLQQERKFKGVYQRSAGLKCKEGEETEEDKIDIETFDMPIHKFISKKYKYCTSFWSKTVAWFYLPIIIILIILFTIIHCNINSQTL